MKDAVLASSTSMTREEQLGKRRKKAPLLTRFRATNLMPRHLRTRDHHRKPIRPTGEKEKGRLRRIVKKRKNSAANGQWEPVTAPIKNADEGKIALEGYRGTVFIFYLFSVTC